MHRMNRQMRIEHFEFLYEQFDKDNEWVKRANLVFWDKTLETYEALCQQWASGTSRLDRIGRTDHQVAIEVQRRADGAACQRESVPSFR